MGFWGVTDCPLKCKVREQFDGRNTLQIWRWSERRLEGSCTIDNQYIYMSTPRRAFPCLGQNWLVHGCRPIHYRSMTILIKGYGHRLYNVDPYLNDNKIYNHEDIHSGFTKLSIHSHDQYKVDLCDNTNYSIATWVSRMTNDSITGSSIPCPEW